MKMELLNYSISTFQVAGHLFQIRVPDSYDEFKLLPSFRAFKKEMDISSGEELIFRLDIVAGIPVSENSGILLSRDFGVYGNSCRLLECGSSYVIELSYAEGKEHVLSVSRDFDYAQAAIDTSDLHAGEALSFFIMFVFAQRGVFYNTFLLHASAITHDGSGLAFLGKSGTGKSTHTSLWVKNISGAALLNDDNPAVRYNEISEQVSIAGTPWSGKTPCYKNEMVKLDAFIRLKQAPFNHFTWIEDVHALLSILTGSSSLRWNYEHYMRLCNLLEKIIKIVPVGCLQCLPDRSAAELCYKNLKTDT
ncbi:MAG: phosphoenolpyruvate carboxykinase [Bacteroidales bacterium]